MALFHITIEKVVVKNDDELLKQILSKIDQLLEDPNGNKKQEILDKLNKAVEDIKQTV